MRSGDFNGNLNGNDRVWLNGYLCQSLSERLDVPRLYPNIYEHIRDRFNVSRFSVEAVSAILDEWNSLKLLNRLSTIVRLPNQRLGRYADSLRTRYIMTFHDPYLVF